MNRREAIERTATQLAAAGIPSPRVDAELLVAEILGCSRPALWLDAHRELTPDQKAQLESWVVQRSRRVPLQHLTGQAPFLEWMLKVTPEVLVPRPETEQLARRAIEKLHQITRTGRTDPTRVLDFATGSGCLALALAMADPSAEVHALDISEAALTIARENAARVGAANRIQFHRGDGFAALHNNSNLGHYQFDLIVTNPPYIPTEELASLEPEVRDHDPRLALDGGIEGLVFYRRLAREAPAWLKPGGWLIAEFGDGQSAAVRRLYSLPDWESACIEPDLSGRERILLVQRS